MDAEQAWEAVVDVKRVAGVYLIAVGVAVGVYFIINPFFVANDTFDVQSVWYVLDVLMVIALPIGLALNYGDKMEERRQRATGGGDLRRYISINAIFYTTAAVTILFLRNWFNLLAHGPDALSGDVTYWVIWAVIDTLLPLVLIVTGLRQLRT